MKLGIDAGHGIGNRGASGNGLLEDDVVLDLANRLGHLWRERFGSDSTVMTRPTKLHVPNVARAIQVKNQNCSAFISFHCNSSIAKAPRGISCWIRAGDQKDRDLSQVMIQSLRKPPFSMPIWGVSGIFEDTQSHVKKIAILRSSGSVPSVLVEVGFLSNPQDAALLKDPKFRQQIAERVRDGIIEYLSKKRSS